MGLGAEILSSIAGAWRLIRFDSDALEGFNLTFQGFWRSFLAAPLVAPVYLSIERTRAEDDPWSLAWSLLIYGVTWLVGPLLMIPVTRILDCQRHYGSYVIAANWLSVPLVLFFGVVWLIFMAGAVAIAAFLNLILLFAILLYSYFVVRLTLGVSALPAAATVAVLFLAELAVQEELRDLLGQ